MTYHLVYDAATAGYQDWEGPVTGAVLTLVGAALVFAPKLMYRLMPSGLQGNARVVFSWIFFVFGLVWTIGATLATLAQYYELRRASLHDQCDEVVGIVSDFVPMPFEGHGHESFTVNTVRFEFSDYEITGGFNRTASHGGPIREGLPVRICYVHRSASDRNIIARLEIAG
jgi:hypothetical protein